jgi:putative ABC transport system substrate-binding protein
MATCHVKLMNKRRRLIVALGAGGLTASFAAIAQPKQVPIPIGWLGANSREDESRLLDSFKQGLAALGWNEGTQFVIEARHADGRTDRLSTLAGELAETKPAVIVTLSAQATRAAAKAAPKTPIVMGSGADPVIAGFAASLARPGGMITGLSNITADITEKYLELLLTVAPKLKRIGFLVDFNNPTRATLAKAAQRSAAQRAVEIHFAEVARPEDIESAFARLAKEGAQALAVMSSAFFFNQRQRIVKSALARHWPVIASSSSWAREGALLSFGIDTFASYHRAASYVDRILKGAKPGDLPIEQPTAVELVINMKTARALKLTIPSELRVRATRIID